MNNYKMKLTTDKIWSNAWGQLKQQGSSWVLSCALTRLVPSSWRRRSLSTKFLSLDPPSWLLIKSSQHLINSRVDDCMHSFRCLFGDSMFSTQTGCCSSDEWKWQKASKARWNTQKQNRRKLHGRNKPSNCKSVLLIEPLTPTSHG